MERKKLHDLIKNSFNYTTPEDNHSIDNSINHNKAFLMGYENTSTFHHVVADVRYVMCEEGMYINWLAVSNDYFTKNVYGCHANKKPFCRIGIATFLLQIVQTQAASLGYNVQ